GPVDRLVVGRWGFPVGKGREGLAAGVIGCSRQGLRLGRRRGLLGLNSHGGRSGEQGESLGHLLSYGLLLGPRVFFKLAHQLLDGGDWLMVYLSLLL
ncbi:hypothetical protein E2562_036116, partial [Oryza meyeriana var. granulata]